MGLRKIDDLTVWKKTGVDGFGKDEFAAPVARSGRWDKRSRRMDDSEGIEFVSKGVVYDDEEFFEVGDRVLNSPLESINDSAETIAAAFAKSFIIRGVDVDRNGAATRTVTSSFLG